MVINAERGDRRGRRTRWHRFRDVPIPQVGRGRLRGSGPRLLAGDLAKRLECVRFTGAFRERVPPKRRSGARTPGAPRYRRPWAAPGAPPGRAVQGVETGKAWGPLNAPWRTEKGQVACQKVGCAQAGMNPECGLADLGFLSDKMAVCHQEPLTRFGSANEPRAGTRCGRGGPGNHQALRHEDETCSCRNNTPEADGGDGGAFHRPRQEIAAAAAALHAAHCGASSARLPAQRDDP